MPNERLLQKKGQTDRQTDRRTDRRTDRQTDAINTAMWQLLDGIPPRVALLLVSRLGRPPRGVYGVCLSTHLGPEKSHNLYNLYHL